MQEKEQKMLQLSAVDVWLTNKRPFAFFKYKMNVKMSDYPTKKPINDIVYQTLFVTFGCRFAMDHTNDY